MHFEKIDPKEYLKHLIKEFWVFENPEPEPEVQKVIPDGFSEIIIHYGDPYKINIGGSWEQQVRILFSNQISKYFFLENTGRSAMIGMKLHPVAFYHLFGVDLARYTDLVVPLENLVDVESSGLHSLTSPDMTNHERVDLMTRWVESAISEKSFETSSVSKAVNLIQEKNGLTDIKEIADSIAISERQLERSFKKVTGVTPKFYSRIIRFNHIFSVVKDGNDSWIRVALESGYFDQSHFIKNFKEFTGEEPSKYGFDEKNLANFFLKK